MLQHFETARFSFAYLENEIRDEVLWESHCHAHFEMIAVLEGDVTLMPEGKHCRLRENRIAIIPPLCYHTVSSNRTGRYRRITAQFAPDAIPEVLRPFLCAGKREVAVFFSPQIEYLREILGKKDVAFYSPLAESLMVEILYAGAQDREQKSQDEADVFLQTVLSFIDQNLHRQISLEELARCVSRSKSSFCHLFEEKMKISPKQYILQKKLALANKLIEDGTPKVLAAMQVGYDNYSNFYRIYKKHFHYAPGVKK